MSVDLRILPPRIALTSVPAREATQDPRMERV
jgi:hypothetical protein